MSRGCTSPCPSSARVDSAACTPSTAAALGAMMSLDARPCMASQDEAGAMLVAWTTRRPRRTAA
eukprot:4047935-Lingulodinium_polyedra.AAC.1